MSSTSRNVYLVRHGEAAASWGQSPDPGLSELGWQQAKDTAVDLQQRVGGANPHLLSSPLARAQETAQPLSEALGVDVEIDARFREIPSTVPLPERQQWLRGFMAQDWSEQDQTLHDWRSAIIDGLAGLPDNTIIFSHFLVINAVVGWIRQEDQTLVCWPDNGSVTTLSELDSVWSVELGQQMQTHVN